jgi:CRISPR-associated protein Cmr1
MKSITFDCEIITPMFLAGADGTTPELRVPSIKGMLRYWWRAINSDLSLDELRKKEAELFGGSDESSGRSKILIKILKQPVKVSKYKPMPHKDRPIIEIDSFSTKQNFQIKFFVNEKDSKHLDTFKNIFILTSILGGLGKRSRRGFGSFKINNIDNEKYNSPVNIEQILNVLNILKPYLFIIRGSRIVLNRPAKENYPYIKEIQIGRTTYRNDGELLKRIGEITHKNDKDPLGFAKGQERLASPIYVSVLKDNNQQYLPITTTLNTAFKKVLNDIDSIQNEFKEEILR